MAMAGASSHETSSSNWPDIVNAFYPNACKRTYCVPPVHFNRVSYKRCTVEHTGQSILVLHKPSKVKASHTSGPSVRGKMKPIPCSLWTSDSLQHIAPVPVQENDFHDDFAQNHVMLNLQKLAESGHEVMFILSQLKFSNYLNDRTYSAAIAQLPKPSDIDEPGTTYSDGEVDFLLIHHQRGILIGELKSVGRSQTCAENPQPPDDAAVAKRVGKAVEQLNRSEKVVKHIVSDLACGLPVRKTIFLPYVVSSQLQRVLDNNIQLQEEVCKSLGASNTQEAVQLCCCSDQLSDPASYWDVKPVLEQLSSWWENRMAACEKGTQLSDQLYLDIVSRFVGPATTVPVPCYNNIRVEVRTAGQAVAELGRRLAFLVLTRQQLELMNKNPSRVFIAGPPGTGKTVVLILQGLRWARQGHDVEVIATRFNTRVVCKLIVEQIEMAMAMGPTPSQKPGSVFYHEYDFTTSDDDLNDAVADLHCLARKKNNSLYILLDEANFHSSRESGRRHRTLVSQLTKYVRGLDVHIWAAGMFVVDSHPAMQTEAFTVPLRSAPSIVREVQTAFDGYKSQIKNYTNCGVPAPGDGPSVIHLWHRRNEHEALWPVDCKRCGQDIAAELRRLGVGSNDPESIAPLCYRDVFVLTRSSTLREEIKDEKGEVISEASGVVCGLRDAKVPVHVIAEVHRLQNKQQWEKDLRAVAVAEKNCVTVIQTANVYGMERRIVVMVPGKVGRNDDYEILDHLDTLMGSSRCTTQLIHVNAPDAPNTIDLSSMCRTT